MANLGILFIRAMNSSLWIAVLVVHVGCIIEAQPSKSSSSSSSSPSSFNNPLADKRSHYDYTSSSADLSQSQSSSSFELLPAASQSASYARHQSSYGKTNLVIDREDRTYGLKPKRLSYQSPNFGAVPSSLSSPSTSGLETDATVSAVVSSTLPITTTKTTTTTSSSAAFSTLPDLLDLEEMDSCDKKADGYYQNLGSACTSYYFCAAGYQISYVCPPGEKFNGKKCEDGYEGCKEIKGAVNPCADRHNGYYSNAKLHGKYFYCFNQAKVIDLQCDLGKFFVGNKCIEIHNVGGSSSSSSISDRSSSSNTMNGANGNGNDYYDETVRNKAKNGDDDDKSAANLAQISIHEVDDEQGSGPVALGTCGKKTNGFYTDEKSACKNYFYCINGEKTELSCQAGFLFNGDICIHSSRYECPYFAGSSYTVLKERKVLGTDGDGTSRRRSEISNDKSRVDLKGQTGHATEIYEPADRSIISSKDSISPRSVGSLNKGSR